MLIWLEAPARISGLSREPRSMHCSTCRHNDLQVEQVPRANISHLYHIMVLWFPFIYANHLNALQTVFHRRQLNKRRNHDWGCSFDLNNFEGERFEAILLHFIDCYTLIQSETISRESDFFET